MTTFQKATRKKAKLKLAVTGPSGSGKTYSALRLATGMGEKIAYIDTENGSASLYSNRFNFDVLDIAPPFTDQKFIDAINAAESAGYDTLVIDSASHFWEGILSYKETLDKRPGSNSYTNWAEAGKKFKGIIDAVLQSQLHVICCLRSKMDYVIEANDKGRQAPRKVGLAPIMRDGIEYEFTTVFDVDMAHTCKTSKDRTGLFGEDIFQITEKTGQALCAWMDSGAAPAPVVVADPAPASVAPAKVGWSSEQLEQVKQLSLCAQELGAHAELATLRTLLKGTTPSDTIDALAELVRTKEAARDAAKVQP